MRETPFEYRKRMARNQEIYNKAHPPFNGDMLSIAIDVRGEDDQDICDKMGISMELLDAYLEGKITPPEGHVKWFMDYLYFPRGFFFREGKRMPSTHTHICYNHDEDEGS